MPESTNKTPLPTSAYVKPLNPDFYNPDEQAKEFFKLETGIEDDELLRNHILAVQAKAFEVSDDELHVEYGRLILQKGVPVPVYPDF